MVRKILNTKDPKLNLACKPVKEVDKKILSLVKDLEDTLRVQKDPEGVGLSANQIGENLRIFVMLDKGKIRSIINPSIVDTTSQSDRQSKSKKSKKEILEGCLSLPNYYSPIKRADRIKIKYLDIDGQEKTEEFKGLSAQIVLHEIDHLNGIIFIQRMLEQKKKLYALEKGEWNEVELL